MSQVVKEVQINSSKSSEQMDTGSTSVASILEKIKVIKSTYEEKQVSL